MQQRRVSSYNPRARHNLPCFRPYSTQADRCYQFSGYFCTGTLTHDVTSIGSDDGKTTGLNGDYVFEYPPITVAWASSDLSKFDPPSAPLLAYRSAYVTVSSAASEPTQQPGASATKHPAKATGSTASGTSTESGGLSTGAKAGIGVGIAVVALIAIGALVWFLLKKRKSRQSASWPSPAPPSQASPQTRDERYEKRAAPNESDTRWYSYPDPPPVHELDSMSSPWSRPEMSSDNIRAELGPRSPTK